MVAVGLASPASGAGVPLGWSQTPKPVKLLASDKSNFSEFGWGVATSKDGLTAVVGADRAGGGGAIYLLSRASGRWVQTAEIPAPGGAQYIGFGAAVGMSADGSTIVVGAPDYGVGLAFVFDDVGGTCTETAELSHTGGAWGDGFGSSVAISSDGSTVVVGAPENSSPEYRGAAYVYSRDHGNWPQVAELTASDGGEDDFFGGPVVVSGDGSTVVVGAPSKDEYVGAVYVFGAGPGGWAQTAEISSPYQGEEAFGSGIAMSSTGGLLAISTPEYDAGQGIVDLYSDDGGTWTDTGQITVAGKPDYSYLGATMAISDRGSVLVLGATHLERQGGAYIFVKHDGVWLERSTLFVPAGPHDYFARAVAVSGDGSAVLIGAPGHDRHSGAVYAYRSHTPQVADTRQWGSESERIHQALR
jgi:hypothetical protein